MQLHSLPVSLHWSTNVSILWLTERTSNATSCDWSSLLLDRTSSSTPMPRHEGIWRGLHKIQYAYTTNVGPPTEQETCHASENKKKMPLISTLFECGGMQALQSWCHLHISISLVLINASLKTTDYDLKTLAIYFYHSIGKKRRMYRVGSK